MTPSLMGIPGNEKVDREARKTFSFVFEPKRDDIHFKTSFMYSLPEKYNIFISKNSVLLESRLFLFFPVGKLLSLRWRSKNILSIQFLSRARRTMEYGVRKSQAERRVSTL